MTTPTTGTATGPSKGERIAILLKSKTLWGAIFGAGAWLASQPKIGIQEIVQALGTVVGAAGVRDAITQHGINP